MKGKLFTLAFIALTALFSRCVREDVCDLCDELSALERRVTDLESATTQLEEMIRKGVLIQSVTEIENGWRITFTGGEPRYIDILHGKDPTGNPLSGTPRIEVRENPDGSTTMWVDYGDGKGWQNTGKDLTGPRGEVGTSPQIKVAYNNGKTVVWYNVTEGYPDSGGFPPTTTSLPSAAP